MVEDRPGAVDPVWQLDLCEVYMSCLQGAVAERSCSSLIPMPSPAYWVPNTYSISNNQTEIKLRCIVAGVAAVLASLSRPHSQRAA